MSATSGGDASGTNTASAGGASTSVGGAPSTSVDGLAASAGTPDPSSASPAPEANAGRAYPGTGFIVHEWGTNTVVSGSDGSLSFGLHHEEEDLPSFVYDRMRVTAADPNIASVKMETPVAYFYSDVPRQVTARVEFPQGILTQWYPAALRFKPLIPGSGPGIDLKNLKDPALDPSLNVSSQYCLDYYRSNGQLDWGSFSVLGRDAAAPFLADAPLAAFTWSYARAVTANFLSFAGGENERFLFYRGVSNVELPARIEALAGGTLELYNLRPEALASVFVVRVADEGGAFLEYPDGVLGGMSRELRAPDPATAKPLPEFMGALSDQVAAALERSGLYEDESRAMVNTWKRQWFSSPGLRVLYLSSQAWTDAVIPLTITPTPDALVRTMMLRVEVLTPEVEADDVAALALMDTDVARGRQHFSELGRFAEPRLRRALTLLPSSAGALYLDELKHEVDRSSLVGE
jgi:hypothetical protein